MFESNGQFRIKTETGHINLTDTSCDYYRNGGHSWREFETVRDNIAYIRMLIEK